MKMKKQKMMRWKMKIVFESIKNYFSILIVDTK